MCTVPYSYRRWEDRFLIILAAIFAGMDWTNYGAILAGASIAVLPTLAIYIAFQKYITTGIALSGLK